ncbi:diadenylate cyclase CdaA [Bacillus sp. ISL-40]|jgi:diadenylate cyclase|uniref:diadenylate cyclase CdaA n=1 Tax=Bacillaceae TaxID=186817 RepID=UPI001BE710F6|nr:MULTISPECIES: diadenylate cyclase CdaA [unclassified Bacillus (in: firmicutes)]MBT2699744.1 diadenylate cyclase CdaA [Bacillus sp. ISL-40]MBT2722243.1 diadenylate cyclase CdaA [Bacillus sp. ISL-46]MBT2740662.1 diadenylate cyclase CdaA [Bacillus sp. ISL-77]
MPFADFELWKYLASIVDIVLVWYVIYKLINVIRGTKAVQLLKGILVILLVRVVSEFLGFQTLSWMMEQAITYGFLAIIIIFQPELRRALEQLGRGKFFSRSSNLDDEDPEKTVEAIVKATDYMAKRRIGALISIERETGMGDYIETGIQLNSNISSELLINIFIPNTPLHDGAVIIQKNNVAAAACYLPLSESPFISKELGTRHRAALGISEVTDSVTVIVSEETGHISLTKNGELHRAINTEQLKELLTSELLIHLKTKQASSARWNWRGKNNG